MEKWEAKMVRTETLGALEAAVRILGAAGWKQVAGYYYVARIEKLAQSSVGWHVAHLQKRVVEPRETK